MEQGYNLRQSSPTRGELRQSDFAYDPETDTFRDTATEPFFRQRQRGPIHHRYLRPDSTNRQNEGQFLTRVAGRGWLGQLHDGPHRSGCVVQLHADPDLVVRVRDRHGC